MLLIGRASPPVSHEVDARRAASHLEHINLRWPVGAARIQAVALPSNHPVRWPDSLARWRLRSPFYCAAPVHLVQAAGAHFAGCVSARTNRALLALQHQRAALEIHIARRVIFQLAVHVGG